MKKFGLILVVWLVMPLVVCRAEEDIAKKEEPISMKTAWTLSVLPVNGLALIYVKRPIVGIPAAILQTAGLTVGTVGAIIFASEDCDSGDFLCFKNGGLMAMGIGYGIWAATYIPTLIFAPRIARKYNEQLSQGKAVIMPAIIPTRYSTTFGLIGHF